MRQTAMGVAVAIGVLLAPLLTRAQDTDRTVKGELIAVNVAASPQVIVVRAMTASGKEMIVGATVGSDTKIMRGGKAARLQDFRAGESVVLRYAKTAEGLVAHAIQSP